MTMRKAAITGPGTARITASALGRNARAIDYCASGNSGAASGYSRKLGDRHTAGPGHVRDCPHETGKQVADSMRGGGALNRSKIDRPGLAPGDMLHEDRSANCLAGGNHAHQRECRNQRPESRPEFEIEAWPPGFRKAHPGRVGDQIRIVDTKQRRNCSAGADADYGRPKAPCTGCP